MQSIGTTSSRCARSLFSFVCYLISLSILTKFVTEKAIIVLKPCIRILVDGKVCSCDVKDCFSVKTLEKKRTNGKTDEEQWNDQRTRKSRNQRRNVACGN